jgi:hypothetical protein
MSSWLGGHEDLAERFRAPVVACHAVATLMMEPGGGPGDYQGHVSGSTNRQLGQDPVVSGVSREKSLKPSEASRPHEYPPIG